MMKQLLFKTMFILATLILTSFKAYVANAQIMRAEELEKYAKKIYGEKWTEAAINILKKNPLDKNNALTFTRIIEAPGKTKEQLYITINYWYSNTFKSGKAVIELNDKSAGVVIGKGYIASIAQHASYMHVYIVNLTPIIKTDIKDGKVRVTYTVPSYDVDFQGKFNKGNKTWLIDECYPYSEKDSHKKTSSKALVMAHAYSNVIMDKIAEAVRNGVTGNENDDW